MRRSRELRGLETEKHERTRVSLALVHFVISSVLSQQALDHVSLGLERARSILTYANVDIRTLGRPCHTRTLPQ